MSDMWRVLLILMPDSWLIASGAPAAYPERPIR